MDLSLTVYVYLIDLLIRESFCFSHKREQCEEADCNDNGEYPEHSIESKRVRCGEELNNNRVECPERRSCDHKPRFG